MVDSLMTNTTVKANAATATMKDYDFEKNNTNTGAGGTIVLTLPSAASLKDKKTIAILAAHHLPQNIR